MPGGSQICLPRRARVTATRTRRYQVLRRDPTRKDIASDQPESHADQGGVGRGRSREATASHPVIGHERSDILVHDAVEDDVAPAGKQRRREQ